MFRSILHSLSVLATLLALLNVGDATGSNYYTIFLKEQFSGWDCGKEIIYHLDVTMGALFVGGSTPFHTDSFYESFTAKGLFTKMDKDCPNNKEEVEIVGIVPPGELIIVPGTPSTVVQNNNQLLPFSPTFRVDDAIGFKLKNGGAIAVYAFAPTANQLLQYLNFESPVIVATDECGPEMRVTKPQHPSIARGTTFEYTESFIGYDDSCSQYHLRLILSAVFLQGQSFISKDAIYQTLPVTSHGVLTIRNNSEVLAYPATVFPASKYALNDNLLFPYGGNKFMSNPKVGYNGILFDTANTDYVVFHDPLTRTYYLYDGIAGTNVAQDREGPCVKSIVEKKP